MGIPILYSDQKNQILHITFNIREILLSFLEENFSFNCQLTIKTKSLTAKGSQPVKKCAHIWTLSKGGLTPIQTLFSTLFCLNFYILKLLFSGTYTGWLPLLNA